ncbi:MAG: DegT/DnrJ/EryC1/StrS family aminotransferase [Acidimicrobiia bacterium]|nr:DegT/DnrJ/EryC1/StrS family aminotransferase [Acidimicrobiia bacterium]
MSEAIPWWEPKLGPPVRRAVLDVLDSTFLNDGPTTRALEGRLTVLIGRRHGVAAPNCTSALALTLMALGIGPGDEVIVPDMTFIATANAVRLAGAGVRLADVEPERLTLDPVAAERAIGPRTRAIIAVDFNGRGADYTRLETLCAAHGIHLLSDSAQALGSLKDSRALGSFGIAGCFSFSAHKLFFSGQGGAVVLDDDALAGRLRDLRDQAKRDGGPLSDVGHPSVGFNFKLPSLLAGVALAQLDEAKARLDHTRARDAWYREFLSNDPALFFLPRRPGEAVLWADVFSDRRDELAAALHAAGIGFRRFYLPLHRQPPYAAADVDFPNALAAWRRGLWLPSALSLTEAQARRVAACLRAALDSERRAESWAGAR